MPLVASSLRLLPSLVLAALLAGLLAAPPADAAPTPPVGTVRQWLGQDEFNAILYRKDYTLRAVGSLSEIWVAVDTTFPAGDCRNQTAGRTTVTDAQAQALADEFDTTIRPRLAPAFSTPPDRDGSNSQIGPDGAGNGGVYGGDGDKTVVLVDNIRDDNYFTFPAAQRFTKGLFLTQFAELFDRNVVTLDADDWAHRTGAAPPAAPSADVCLDRPAAPRDVEATLARVWQRLTQYYDDPAERDWVTTGLSELAPVLTGYVDPSTPVTSASAYEPLACFTGYGVTRTPARDCGGPASSLTRIGERPVAEAPADRGGPLALMVYLRDRFGTDLIQRLAADDADEGLAGLDAALAGEGGLSAAEVLHDFQVAVLTDDVAGADGTVTGVERDRVTAPSLRSTLNLDNPAVEGDAGAAPNGADYVRLEDGTGAPLPGKRIESLAFEGAPTLEPAPLRWSTVADDPDRAGDPVLFSGNANSLDSAAVVSVDVPTADPTLTLQAKYGAEPGYDYGYVQVSTDGGATYASLAGDRTVNGPLGPGLTGTTTGFEPHTFSLTAYAGQTVLLSLRYVSDGAVNEGGLRVDDLKVGGTLISDGSSVAPFRSPEQVRPVPVAWNLRLVGLDPAGEAVAVKADVDGQRTVSLDRAALKLLAPFPTVVAVVAYDDAGEGSERNAAYTLTATEGDPPAAPTATPTPTPTPTPTSVAPATSAAPPTSPPATAPAVSTRCDFQGVALLGIEPAGTPRRRIVRLTGLADASLRGATVRIERDGRRVGTTTVQQDGSITAAVRAPASARARAIARYRLVAAGTQSSGLKATRRARITGRTVLADGRLRIRGRIAGVTHRRTLAVSSRLLCTGAPGGPALRVRTDRRGRFTVTLTPPSQPGRRVLVRIRLLADTTVTLPVLLTGKSPASAG